MEGLVLGRSDDQGSEMKEEKLEMNESDGEKPNRKSEDATVFEDGLLESTRAEMGQVREENKRLKLYLDQIMRDYSALQRHCSELMINKEGIRDKNIMDNNVVHSHNHLETDQESELVSLSLGRSISSDSKKEEDNKMIKQDRKHNNHIGKIEDKGLTLGLDCKFEACTRSETTDSLNNNNVATPGSSFEGPKEELNEEMWPPSKVLKTMRSGDGSGDEASHQQNPVKKARVSVRARCDAPTMNDGCQWRKYGQKIAKGNPCPRAYYRCTVAPSCPVRKQVQRCAEDMSILTTTYEGTHNHPLPMAATAMASTTSAAARMLLSGSSSSGQAFVAPLSSTTATTTYSALGLRPSDQFSKPGLMYFPSTSSSISSSTCPTITLDLTSSNPLSSSVSSSLPSTYYSPQFGRFSANFLPTSRFSSSSTSSLNFTSPNEPSNALPFSWTNNNGLMPNFGTQLLNKNNHVVALDHQLGSHSNLQRSGSSSFAQPSLPPDTIAAATKAITADPNFQSVLAAALKSIIGNSNGGGTSEN